MSGRRLALVGFALVACGDTTAGDAGPEGDATTSDAQVEDSSSSGLPDGSSSGTSGVTPDAELPAVGIEITRIELNQGVAIPVFPDEPPMAPVLADRRGVVHAAFDLAPDFEPRVVVARLEVHGPDGQLQTLEERRRIEAAPDDIADGFDFHLAAADFTPGLELRLTLWEATPGPDEGNEENAAPTTPKDVNVQPTRTRLQLTLVPMSNEVDIGSCPRPAPEVSESDVGVARAWLELVYPLQEVEVTVRDPVPLDFNVVAIGEAQLLALLADLRVEDDAAPADHYVALVEPCVGDNGEWLSPERGFSHLNDEPDEQDIDAGHRRVMVVTYEPRAIGKTLLFTLPHEVGHNLGRKHVTCRGDEADPDPIYPHEGGGIGANGWSELDGTIYPPETPDFMGYCTSTTNWVSAFGWGRVFPVLEAQADWPQKSTGPIRWLAIGDTTAGRPSTWHAFRVRGDAAVGPGRIGDSRSTFEVAEVADLVREGAVVDFPAGA